MMRDYDGEARYMAQLFTRCDEAIERAGYTERRAIGIATLADKRPNKRPMDAEERRKVTALTTCTSSMLRDGGFGKAARAIVDELRGEMAQPVPHITPNIAGRVHGWYKRLREWNTAGRVARTASTNVVRRAVGP